MVYVGEEAFYIGFDYIVVPSRAQGVRQVFYGLMGACLGAITIAASQKVLLIDGF